MRNFITYLSTFCLLITSSFPVAAVAQSNMRITQQDLFIELTEGKKLKRFMIELFVEKNGSITGIGAGTEITGSWNWKDGYFCRRLSWGNRDLGTDCQLVELKRKKLYFTSQQGQGATAGFSIK